MIKQVTANNSPLAAVTLAASRQLWWAGLGAFTTLRARGNRVFNELVKEGKTVEARAIKFAGHRIEQAATVADATWMRTLHIWQERVASPFTKKMTSIKPFAAVRPAGTTDLQTLANRIDELNASVKALSRNKRSR